MLVVNCPECGAIAPIRLDEPGLLRCASCRREGPPSADAAAAIARVAELVSKLDARERQLTKGQRIAIINRRLLSWIPKVIVYGIFLSLLFYAVGMSLTLLTASYWDAFYVMVGFISVVPVGIFAYLMASARRQYLESIDALTKASLARVPARPSEPYRCRVCGAALVASGERTVCRCSFCRADSLIDPAVLATHSEVQCSIFDDVESYLHQQGKEAFRSGLGLLTRSLWSVVVAFVSPCLVVCFLMLPLAGIERADDPSKPFMGIRIQERVCFGEPQGPVRDGKQRLGFQHAPFGPVTESHREVPVEQVVMIPTAQVLGATGRAVDGREGRIVRIFRDVFGLRRMTLDVPGLPPQHVDQAQVCLVPQ